MKVFKNKYGWSTSAHSKNMMGEQVKCYVDVTFKKGEEPLMEEIEGKLVFKGDDGTERDCFLSSYEKKSNTGKIVVPKLVMMGKRTVARKKEDPQTVLNDGKTDMFGRESVEIDPEELPFY